MAVSILSYYSLIISFLLRILFANCPFVWSRLPWYLYLYLFSIIPFFLFSVGLYFFFIPFLYPFPYALGLPHPIL